MPVSSQPRANTDMQTSTTSSLAEAAEVAVTATKPGNTPPTQNIADAELVQRVRDGNINAYEVIIRRHNQRLFRIARSIVKEDHEAMDVVQDTWVKAFYQLEQLKDPAGLIGWLSRITGNEAMMRLRKSRRIQYTADDLEDTHPDRDLSGIQHLGQQPMDKLANKQLRQLLEAAIDQLGVDYRSVYVMRAIQQLSVRETAQILEISEDAVKTRYLRARRSLQKSFESHLKQAQMEVFEFAGHRCDAIVKGVLARLTN